jgi:hypothetical protein
MSSFVESNRFLIAVVQDHVIATGSTPTLAELGSLLTHWGTVAPSDFTTYAIGLVDEDLRGACQQIEQRMQTTAAVPSLWREDMAELLAHYQSSIAMLPSWQPSPELLTRTQAQLRDYGELLRVWEPLHTAAQVINADF